MNRLLVLALSAQAGVGGPRLTPGRVQAIVAEGCALSNRNRTSVNEKTYQFDWRPFTTNVYFRMRVISDTQLALIAGDVACSSGHPLIPSAIANLPLHGRFHVLTDLSYTGGAMSSALLKYGEGDGDVVIQFEDGDVLPSLESQGAEDPAIQADWTYIEELYLKAGVDIRSERGQFGSSGRLFLKRTFAPTPRQLNSVGRFVVLNRDGRKDASDKFRLSKYEY